MSAAQDLNNAGLAEIAAAADLGALDATRVKYLGKKGLVTEALKTLGKLDPDKLQEAIALVKKSIEDFPLQFKNFRD